VQAANNFDVTFLNDTHPVTRSGLMEKVITGFIGMRRAVCDDRPRGRWRRRPMCWARVAMRSGVTFMGMWFQ